MLKRILLVGSLLALAAPAFAQFDFTARASKDQMVALESTNGTSVSVSPLEIQKTKEIKIPFNIKRTGYFELPATLPQTSPVRIHFGSKDPEKGWGLRLARLTPKEGKVEVTMKMGAFSMSTTKDSNPYVEDITVPKAVKGEDGQFILTLPKPLAPGIYGVIGFNGSSTSLFSKKDGIAWVFEVPNPAVPLPAGTTVSPKPADAVPGHS